MSFCARTRRPEAWLALLVLLGASGCSLFSSDPVFFPVCVKLEASPRLNWFRGSPHTVFARVAALSSSEAFEAAKVDALLGDQPPFLPGMVGAPRQAHIHPGTTTTVLLDAVNGQTFGSVGVVVGYYQPLGKSRLVVPTKDLQTDSCVVVSLGESGIEDAVETVPAPTPTPED